MTHGRKKDNEHCTLSIRFPNEMRKELEQHAKEKTLPVTLFIRMLLKEWLDKKLMEQTDSLA